ncbi:MAG: hypothetical protein WDO56_12175 [Gammaproteobacteria bacterium]
MRFALCGRNQAGLLEPGFDRAKRSAVTGRDLRQWVTPLELIEQIAVLFRTPRSANIPGELRTTRGAHGVHLECGHSG